MPTTIIQNRQNIRLFIGEDDVKTYCPISANITTGTLFPAMFTAQNLYIRTNLTEKLYLELENEWILSGYNPANLPDSSQSSTGVDYKELYKQIYMPLIWRAFVLFIPDTGIKIDEKGVMIASADFAENTGVNDVYRVQKQRDIIAAEWMDKLICYLNETFKDDNRYDFYKSNTPQNGTNKSGIYFPNQHNKCKKC